jgi:hypothetical protein
MTARTTEALKTSLGCTRTRIETVFWTTAIAITVSERIHRIISLRKVILKHNLWKTILITIRKLIQIGTCESHIKIKIEPILNGVIAWNICRIEYVLIGFDHLKFRYDIGIQMVNIVNHDIVCRVPRVCVTVIGD